MVGDVDGKEISERVCSIVFLFSSYSRVWSQATVEILPGKVILCYEGTSEQTSKSLRPMGETWWDALEQVQRQNRGKKTFFIGRSFCTKEMNKCGDLSAFCSSFVRAKKRIAEECFCSVKDLLRRKFLVARRGLVFALLFQLSSRPKTNFIFRSKGEDRWNSCL